MNESEVILSLNKWFLNNSSNPRKWSSPLGQCIKQGVEEMGNWKNAPRGNPRKAKIFSDKAKYERQYGKLPEREDF